MRNKAWMVYVAYAVLVVGTAAALFLAERPISATVVSLALFSFNLAAILFVAPMLMGYLARLKENTEKNDNEILLQLKEIRARLSLLNGSSPVSPTAQQIPLKNALVGTAAATTLTAQNIQKTSVQPLNKPSTSTAAGSYTNATLSQLHNAVPMNSPENVKPPLADSPIMDHIFNKPHAPVIHRTQPIQPSTPASRPHQTDLFGASSTTPSTLTPPNSSSALSSSLSSQLPSVDGSSSASPHTSPAEAFNSVFASASIETLSAITAPTTEPTAAPTTSTPADISVIVNANVTEDDVLCIRGEGTSSLNWQEGLPMSYDGNDRWRWTAPAQTTPITVRVYLNDEISAFGDDLVLQPGQSIEISPTFPQIEA